MPRWLAKLSTLEWTPSRLAALAVVLMVPALWQGFFADDHLHQWVMHNADAPSPAPSWWADMFRFIDNEVAYADPIRAAQVLPWFADPEIHIAFARPVSAATMWLDHLLLPDNPVWAHVHSLLWLGLAVGLGAWVYRRVGLAGHAAALAGLMFAFDEAHAYPATWVANRATLVALVFAFLAFEAHRSARTSGRKIAWLSLPALALTLLAKESGLAVLAWIAAWELHVGPDHGEGGEVTPLRQRLKTTIVGLAPALVVFACWRWFYAWGNYGVRGSAVYIDPAAEPLAYALASLERGPQLLLALLTPIPLELAISSRAVAVGLVVLGAAVTLAVGLWLRPAWRSDARVRMFVTATLLSLAPVCSAPASGRLLTFAGFPAFGALALALVCTSDGEREDTTSNAEPERWSAALHALVITLVPLSALQCPLQALTVAPIVDSFYGSFGRYLDRHPECHERDIILLNGVDMILAGGALHRASDLSSTPRAGPPPSMTYLGSNASPLRVERVAADSLELHAPQGWVSSLIEGLTVARLPALGEARAHHRFVAKVLEVNEEGRPTRVRFDFDVPLDDPSLCWVQLVDGAFEPGTLPRAGEHLELAPSLPR